MVGYSPWGGKDSDTTDRLHFLSFFSLLFFLRSNIAKRISPSTLNKSVDMSTKLGEELDHYKYRGEGPFDLFLV